MKKFCAAVLMAGLFLLGGCSGEQADITEIQLADSGITVDGAAASADPAAAVYVGADIIYYADGTDETYGEGEEDEKHSADEALAHTVVTITAPGTYKLSGELTQGQIAVDLGENAETDPNAVVTLILDNADVSCGVAPALIFYNVYECGDKNEENASGIVDTSAAGANIILAKGSENNFTGSHVARIYEPGTEDKLHKYDGAFYSKMTMNINGDNGDDSGVLNIVGDNEGMNSEMHLTINGGTINIASNDDGINTNEDNISVTTINGGNVMIIAGLGEEGDGIDSNGYLTINGGTLMAQANPRGADGGIDADCDITINGGVVAAYGTMNGSIAQTSSQNYMESNFMSFLPEGTNIKLTDAEGKNVWAGTVEKGAQMLTLSTSDLALDTEYHLYVNDVQQCWTGVGGRFSPDGMGGPRPELPEDFDPAQMGERPEFSKDFAPGQAEDLPEMPKDFFPVEDGERPELPEDFDPAQMGERPEKPHNFNGGAQTAGGEVNIAFVLTAEQKSFMGICDFTGSAE